MRTKKRPNWGHLAQHLGVVPRTLSRWKHLPGCPATPDVEAWRKFVEENSLGIAPNKLSPARAKLLEENLRKKNHLLDLQIAEKENRMIDAAAVNDFLHKVAFTQKTVFYAMLEGELPPRLVGKDQAEMSVAGREMADRLCDIFSQELDQWISMLPTPKPAKPGAAG